MHHNTLSQINTNGCCEHSMISPHTQMLAMAEHYTLSFQLFQTGYTLVSNKYQCVCVCVYSAHK